MTEEIEIEGIFWKPDDLDTKLQDFDVIEDTDEKFHIGQEYTTRPDTKIRCVLCHGDKFEVGRGNYHTAIRCVTCQWELCIHEG